MTFAVEKTFGNHEITFSRTHTVKHVQLPCKMNLFVL